MEQYIHYIGDAVVIIFTIYLIIKEKIKTKDAILLLLNALKNEYQMPNAKFDPKLLEKINKIKEITEASEEAAKEIHKEIEKVNRRKGIKVASIHGKPIFLRDAVNFFSKIIK